jgi:hypothetical protein
MFFISPRYISINQDIDFYINNSNILFSEWQTIINLIYGWYINPSENVFFSGPILPILIKIFAYSKENPIPLNIFFLTLGIIFSSISIEWLIDNGIKRISAFFIALCPQFLLFSFQGGTDIIYCLLSFYFYILLNNDSKYNIKIILLVLTLVIFTRPNGFILILYLLYKKFSILIKNKSIIVYIALLSTISILYYLPYGVSFIRASIIDNELLYGVGESYMFNSLPSGYLQIPEYLFTSLYVILLKILKLFGLYLSSSGNYWNTLIRFIFGSVLLFGFTKLLMEGEKSDQIYSLLFILPCILGHSSERYVLAIYPVIYLYAMLNIEKVLKIGK